MSRGAVVRFLLVLGLLAGCAAVALGVKPNLGLDLRGGAQFVFQATGTEEVPANAENVDKTLEVLRGRVDALGVAESTLVRQGSDRILVELPGVTNDEEAQEAEEQIGKTAKLTAHAVIGTVSDPEQEPKKGNQVLQSDQGDSLEIGPVVLSGDDVTGADALQREDTVGYVVALDFSGSGGDKWADITGKAACNPLGDPKRRVAIVLDEQIITSPEVNEGVGCDVGIQGGSTDITGNFSQAEAKELAALIEGGSLPLELELISDRLVGPTLGAEAIDASIEAGIIGLILTGLFIMVVYRLVGAMATLALTSYALLAYAMLLALGSTLTLPGLAGFVLAIGMAIDANVLVFERAREEYAAYPSAGLRRALAVGFNKAWSAIIDSNVTTLLAAALLFILGSGPIKGFGVTLLDRCHRVHDLGADHRPGALRDERLHQGRRASPGDQRTGQRRQGPRVARPVRLRHHGQAPHVAQHLRRRAGAGRDRHLHPGPQPRCRVHGGRQLDYSVSRDVSVDEARAAIADAGFAEAVVQDADTAGAGPHSPPGRGRDRLAQLLAPAGAAHARRRLRSARARATDRRTAGQRPTFQPGPVRRPTRPTESTGDSSTTCWPRNAGGHPVRRHLRRQARRGGDRRLPRLARRVHRRPGARLGAGGVELHRVARGFRSAPNRAVRRVRCRSLRGHVDLRVWDGDKEIARRNWHRRSGAEPGLGGVKATAWHADQWRGRGRERRLGPGTAGEDPEPFRLTRGHDRASRVEPAAGRDAARVGCLTGEDLLLHVLLLGHHRQQRPRVRMLRVRAPARRRRPRRCARGTSRRSGRRCSTPARGRG